MESIEEFAKGAARTAEGEGEGERERERQGEKERATQMRPIPLAEPVIK